MSELVVEDIERNELRRLGLPLAFSSRATNGCSQRKRRRRRQTDDDDDDVAHTSAFIDGINDDNDDDDEIIPAPLLRGIPPPTGKRVVFDVVAPPSPARIPPPATPPPPPPLRDNSRQRRRRQRHGMFPQRPPPIDSASTCPHSKYWSQRYRLFSRWDFGVQLDGAGWFSATPQRIAHHQAIKASRLTNRAAAQCTAVDAMCGCGGNAIALAHYFGHVVAVDIDGARLAMARNNARIYDVEARIDFVHGDYLKLAHKLSADVVVLAPEWGGMEYLQQSAFSLASLLPVHGERLFTIAQSAAPSVIVYVLPRNVRISDIRSLCRRRRTQCDVESNLINGKIKLKTLYFQATQPQLLPAN